MELKLKDRKRINNLQGYKGGTEGYSSLMKIPRIKSEPLEYAAPGTIKDPGLKDPGLNWNGLDLRKAKPLDVDTSGGKKPSSAAGIGPWFALGEYVGSGIGAGINSIRNADSIQADAGRSEGTVNGISYEKLNEIDVDAGLKLYKREAGLSFLTNPFKGITMFAGLRKQRREMRRAALEANEKNELARAGAATDYLQLEYYSKHGDPTNQVLYATNGHDAVQTSEGEMPVVANSRVQGQEGMFNDEIPGHETAHQIKGSPKGGDRYLAYTKPGDTIYTLLDDIAKKASPFVKALENANRHEDTPNRGSLGKQTDKFVKSQTVPALKYYKNLQHFERINGNLPNETYKKGYALGKEGWWSNWWIDGLGALSGIGKMITDSMQKIKTPSSYRSNPYGRYAMNKLASLRIDPYPIVSEMRNQDRRNLYAINRAGGLRDAQKMFANIASGLGTQSAIGSVYSGIQKQNNEYAAAAANALNTLGEANRQHRMSANQYDLDYYSKAHGAKQDMINQDWYNTLASLQQGYKNSFDYYIANKLYDVYNLKKKDE